MKRLPLALLALLVPAGCGAEYAGDPGGNVGFGGAQDMGQFRGILEAGGIPGEETLDANGFFNEHYTEAPPADCGQTLCVHGMLSVARDWLWGDYQATLQLALSTPLDPATVERQPLDLVLVVDTSGSMAIGDRIGYVREGLHLLIDALDDGDRAALVSYDSQVTVLAGFAELDREDLHARVDALRATGATNFYEGLRVGFDLAEEVREAGRQTRVILLSDGQPTTGITDTESILSMADERVRLGIGLTTIGVGDDFNVALMRGLAERGAGNFYFVESPEAAREVFVDELDYFTVPLALSVDIEVEAGPGYDLGEVVGTRLWKADGVRGSVFVPAVFLSRRASDDPSESGRRGGGSSLFVHMEPRAGEIDEPGRVARIRLRYRLPDSDEVHEQVIEAVNPAAPGIAGEEAYYSHRAMAEHYAAYNMYLGLREATRHAAWDYDCALSVLRRLDDSAARWNAVYEDPDIEADRALVALFIENLVARGARGGELDEQGSCVGGSYPDDYGHDHYHCSAGGGAGGNLSAVVIIVLAAGVATRRPRRRGAPPQP